jgi:hypothetical protein
MYEKENPALPPEIMAYMLGNPTITELLKYKANNMSPDNGDQIENRKLINNHILELLGTDGIMVEDIITIIKSTLKTRDETDFKILIIKKINELSILDRLSPNDFVKAFELLKDEQFRIMFGDKLEALSAKYISEMNLPYLDKMYSNNLKKDLITTEILRKIGLSTTTLKDIISISKFNLEEPLKTSIRDKIRERVDNNETLDTYDIINLYDIINTSDDLSLFNNNNFIIKVNHFFERIPKIPAGPEFPTGDTIAHKIAYMKMYLVLYRFYFSRRITPENPTPININNNYSINIKNKFLKSQLPLLYTIRISSIETVTQSPYIYPDSVVVFQNGRILPARTLNRDGDNFESMLQLCSDIYRQLIGEYRGRPVILDINYETTPY